VLAIRFLACSILGGFLGGMLGGLICTVCVIGFNPSGGDIAGILIVSSCAGAMLGALLCVGLLPDEHSGTARSGKQAPGSRESGTHRNDPADTEPIPIDRLIAQIERASRPPRRRYRGA
jgi:hypothetical protein